MEIQWPLLAFSILSGTSSGMLVYLGIGEIRRRPMPARFPTALLSLILLAAGGGISALHLGHPERALHIMGNIGSGLSRELVAVGIAGIILLAYTILARKDYPKASRTLAAGGLAMGIVLPCVAGSSFVMASRPAWDSFTVPLMYLGGGLGLGLTLAALLSCMPACRQKPIEDEEAKADAAVAADTTRSAGASGTMDTERGFALKMSAAGVVCAVISTIFYVVWIAVAPHQDETRSIMRLLTGDLAICFWLGVAVCGIIAPIILGAAMYGKERLAQSPRKNKSSSVFTAQTKTTDAATASPGTLAATGADTAADPDAGFAAAGLLTAAFVCLLAGSIALRSIMYLAGTSVQQLIY